MPSLNVIAFIYVPNLGIQIVEREKKGFTVSNMHTEQWVMHSSLNDSSPTQHNDTAPIAKERNQGRACCPYRTRYVEEEYFRHEFGTCHVSSLQGGSVLK